MRYLVTGANRGIGLELTRQLLVRGDEVLATARQPEEAGELTGLVDGARGRLQVEALDIASPESVAALGQLLEHGELDVLVNNAGVYPEEGPVGAFDYDALRKAFEINTLGPLRVLEAALPALRRGRARKVVNVTSKMGSIEDNTSGGSYAYRMSKCALNAATRSLAHDLSREGFVCFVIHPGWVLTRMGGPNALIDTRRSVEGMLSVIDAAGGRESGQFMEWSGGKVGW